MIFAAIERGGEARAAVVPSASAVALDPLTPCGVHSVQMFGWFDRCPQGTPQGVKHLHRYAPEHQFRYNGRRHDAGERMTP